MMEIKKTDIDISNHHCIQCQNSFFKSSWNFKIQELRLILVLLANINKSLNHFELCQAPVNSIGKAMGLGSDHTYEYIKKAINTIKKRPIFIFYENKWVHINWFKVLRYHSDTTLFWQFNDNLKEMLLQINPKYGFVEVTLSELLKLEKPNAIRMMLLFTKWEKLSPYTMTLDDLRFHLGFSQNYKQSSDFIKNVIKPAIEEINDKSKFMVTANFIKKGLKFEKVEFTITNKQKLNDSKTITSSAKTHEKNLTDEQQEALNLLLSNGLEQHYATNLVLKRHASEIKDIVTTIINTYKDKSKINLSGLIRSAFDNNWGDNMVLNAKQKEQQAIEKKKSSDEFIRMQEEALALEHEKRMQEYRKNNSDEIKLKFDKRKQTITAIAQDLSQTVNNIK